MKDRLLVVCIYQGIYFSLLFGFVNYLVPIFTYEGYVFEPKSSKLMVSMGLTLALSILTPIDGKKPSTFFLNLALVFALIPMLVLFYAEDKPWSYSIQAVIGYALIVLLVKVIKPFLLGTPSLEDNKILRMLLSLSVLYIISVFALGGYSYFNLDISKVYDFRTDAAKNLPGVFGYISPLVGKVIIPFAFVLALTSKKYSLALLSFSLAILAFGLTAHKGTMFYPFLIYAVYLFIDKKKLIVYFFSFILFLLLLANLDLSYFITMDIPPDDTWIGWFGTLLLNRTFIVPAGVNYNFYDFFSSHDLVYWGDSKLSLGLVPYKYPIDPQHFIGSLYYGSEATGANTGWLGSGYMQAGFIGIISYSIIIAFVFKYIDTIAKKAVDRRIVIASTIVPIFDITTSTDLPTAFLTGGFMVNLVLISLLKRKY